MQLDEIFTSFHKNEDHMSQNRDMIHEKNIHKLSKMNTQLTQ